MDDVASHDLVKRAIKGLERMTHRGAIAADGKTGDGCGLLMKKPDRFLRRVAKEAGIEIGAIQQYAAGNLFLSLDETKAARARTVLQDACAHHGLTLAGWRVMPVNPEACGAEALAAMPRFEQVFVTAPASMHRFEFELKLFKARRRAEKLLSAEGDGDFYVTSLSCRVIVYKGLLMPEWLPVFYTDLAATDLESSICVFHERFSTNTMPKWKLCHPTR